MQKKRHASNEDMPAIGFLPTTVTDISNNPLYFWRFIII